jgi:hypothetical protein
MSDIISLDYETFYSKECSVVDWGYYGYTRHPQFHAYMVSVCDGKETWAGSPDEFDFSMLEGKTLLSHNAAFDQEVMLSDVERGRHAMPKIKAWHCTANMSSYLWNVRSLADAVRTGLGLAVNKGVRDRAKGKTWEDMVKEGWADDMLKYAQLDAQHCWTLFDKFGDQWPDWERRLSDLTIRQGRRGVHIDRPRLEDYMQTLQRVIHTAQQSLPWIERGRAPASPLGMAEECRTASIPPPPVKVDDPEAAEAWEAEYAPQFPWVMGVRNLRKAKKALATMETIKLRLKPDDTVPFSLKYFGAHTGRWAGDAGWNLQNQPKSPLFVLPDGTFELRPDRMKELDYKFETGTLTEAQALDVRGLITARPGFKLVMSDLAQIEPRVLNWMAGNKPLLQLVAAGMSIYEAFARTSMGWTGGELKKEDKKLYQLCKIMVLGLGYGCGWNKFITIAAQYGIDLTEEDEKYAGLAAADGLIHERRFSVEADDWLYSSAPEGAKVKIVEPNFAADAERVIFVKKVKPRTGEEYLQPQGVRGQQSRSIVQKFRDSNPLIVALWREADEALAAAQGGDYVVPLPSGRKLTYRQVRMGIREFTDPETKKKTEQRCLTAVVGGRRTILYGGLLVENVTQAIGRDVFAHNWLACEDSQVESLFTVHDENVPEVPSEGAEAFASVVQYCMSQCPDWLEGCPVGAETKISERYAK